MIPDIDKFLNFISHYKFILEVSINDVMHNNFERPHKLIVEVTLPNAI